MCMYAMHFLNDVHTSEDLVQECFMSYWERFLNISGNPSGFPASPKQYLFAMVRNRCIDLIRKESGKDSSVNLSEAERFAADEESVDMSFLEARMWTAIDSLPEKRRKIFLMAKRDGMKYEEIAEVLNISVNTVRNQMAKALDAVKSGNGKVLSYVLIFF